MKGAVVLSGFLRNYRQCIDNFLANFIEPNDLDVYCSFQHDSSIQKRLLPGFGPEVPDVHDEEAFLREKFGDRLKLLHWDDWRFNGVFDPEPSSLRQRLIAFHQFEYAKAIDRYKGQDPENQWFAADQFARLSTAAEKTRAFCAANNLSYDYVVRFRIDINVTRPVLIAPVFETVDDVYIIRGYACSVKEMFVAQPTAFFDICISFPHTIFNYTPKNFYPNFLAPEFQLGQFLRVHKYRCYEWPIQYSYNDSLTTGERVIESYPLGTGATPILITPFTSDMTRADWESALKIDPKLLLQAGVRFVDDTRSGAVLSTANSRSSPKTQDTDLETTTTTPSNAEGVYGVYFVLFVVFLTLFVITNAIWLYRHSKAYRLISSEKIKTF